MLKQAILLKSTIEKAITLNSIGSCNEMYREWYLKNVGKLNDDDTENSENDTVLSYIEMLRESNGKNIINILNMFEILHKNQTHGFILNYNDSFHDSFIEKVLTNALEEMNKSYVIIPVLHNFILKSLHGHPSEDTWSSKIYPLTEDCINLLLNNNNNSNEKYKNVKFHQLEQSLLWSETHQKYMRCTGNKTCPEEQNSLYISRALIIL